MNKVCTTITQSRKLIELGLDIKTADMFWDTLFSKTPEAQVNNHHYIDEYDDEHRFPAWSLSCLLGMLPKLYEEESDGGCYPRLCRSFDSGRWHVVYRSSIYITPYYEDPLDAAVNVVCWLLENNEL